MRHDSRRLAAVAKDEWAAIRCANAVQAKWSEWQGLPEPSKLWDHVRATYLGLPPDPFDRTGSRFIHA